VIASDCGGIPEIIEQGCSGWLVPSGDADALRKEIIARLADRSALEAVRMVARKRSHHFDADHVAHRVADLLAGACSEQSGLVTRAIFNNGYRRYFLPDDRKTPFYRLYDAKRRAVAAELASATRLRILDVGGGYGRITGPFAEHHDVTLVDISEDMLAEARERFPALKVRRCDARMLPFEASTFDLVIALDVLCHLPDLHEGARELSRVTRPGGRVVCDITNANPLWVLAYPRYVRYRPARLVATMRFGGVLPEWKRIVRHYWDGEVRAALVGAGLDLERTESFGPPVVPKWCLWWCRRLQAKGP
jgi:glycogen(starch) synthase